ncbi:hypothetical protein AB1Y20_015057 [Prymnesium parvum]|uniref:Nucleotide-diphospho-sugar transferase domain-containing protein n=1 Tax=Prymnesium parvum TaxID=97485 RepID=A0AB34JZJ5_PRYPA
MPAARRGLLLLLLLAHTARQTEARERDDGGEARRRAPAGARALRLGGSRRRSAVAPATLAPGVLWRLRLHGSARYAYVRDGTLTTSRRFFSLFRVHPAGAAGAWRLEAHGAGFLSLDRLSSAQATLRCERGANASSASTFWLLARPGGLHAISTSGEGRAGVCEAARRHDLIVAERGAAACALPSPSDSAGAPPPPPLALFEWQPIVRPDAPAASEVGFAARVKRSAVQASGRDVVLATYHNVGMMHWAVLFWGWLRAAGIDKLLLLDLDGLSCAASQSLAALEQIDVRVSCVGAADLQLGAAYEGGGKTSALQEWGTRANSGYFKFLRMKLRLVELAVRHVDVVMADVDVLVLRRGFLEHMVDTAHDLAISSDARTGSYDDNRHCPLSSPMYQRLAADWVCAGLFYMRRGSASHWVIQQVQNFMDSYAITDQDAFQVLLTGHSQVAMPQVPVKQEFKGSGKFAEGQSSPLSPGYRPSGAFLKPLWLEDLSTPGNLRNLNNIQALNTPMRAPMYRRLQAKLRGRAFTWTTLPVELYANGPVLFEHWESTFSKASRANLSFLSVHSNCNTKHFLESARGDTSFLLSPEP